MAKKEVPILKGKVIIVVKDKYTVSEKPLPKGLPKVHKWLGNFEVTLDGDRSKLKTPDKYEIQVPADQKGKRLIFWDGKTKVNFTSQKHNYKEFQKNNKKYKSAELDLSDPPIGWN